MANTIPVGKYYNFDNKNVDVVYNPAKDENKGSSGGGLAHNNMPPYLSVYCWRRIA